MPTIRSDLSVSAVNGLIYAFGGWDPKALKRLSAVEVYNPATDTWKKLGDMPTAREEFTTSAVDGKIYLFGGYTVVERRGRKIVKQLTTVEVFDPAANAWEQKADAPVARRRQSSAVVNGKIYVMAGGTNVGGGGTLLQIYDPATDTWQKGADLIQTRWAASSAVVNGKIYVFGGYRKEQNMVEVVEEYDPATDTWTRKADMPEPRYHAGVHSSAAGGKIYVIGGHNLKKLQKIVEEYDPATDTWALKKSMLDPLMSSDTAVVKGKIYVIGGIGGRGGGGIRGGGDLDNWAGPLGERAVATVFAYTPEGWPFAVSPQGKLATTWGTMKATD